MSIRHRRPRPALWVLATALTLATAAPATGQVPGETLPAPATTVSADGRSATDGVRTLSVSKAAGLAAGGEAVTVEGRGYDVNKGVYVAYCVIPPTNQLPTPCGGGADLTGGTGASQWISSNAPSYGGNLARPYGPGGSFSVTITTAPTIGSVDCRRVRCAIVTRNDHVRTSDRSQDIFIPVTFASDAPAAPAPGPTPGPTPGAPADPGAPAAPAPDAPPPPPPTTTTTAPQAPPDEALPAPEATVDDDGRRVSDGTRELVVSKAQDLEEPGEVLIVTGSGFDETRGIRVAWCALGDGDAAPGPCATTDAAAALAETGTGTDTDAEGDPGTDDAETDGPAPGGPTWISSTPPADAPDGAAPEPYGPAGSFGLGLAAVAEIDADTDCREVPCGVVTLPDPTRPLDRSQELALPVSFAAPDVAEDEPEPEVETDEVAAAPTPIGSTDDDGGSAAPLVLGVLAAVVIAGGATTAVVRSRRTGAA